MVQLGRTTSARPCPRYTGKRSVLPGTAKKSYQKQCFKLALSFLILSSWLIDEAAEHGLRLAQHDLERRVQERQEALPNGRAEFEASLRASGRTIADVELEIYAQWAATVDRHQLLTRAGEAARSALTSAAVASYYHRNIARHSRSERRDFDIAERIPSKAAASRLAMQIRQGRPFTVHAMKSPLRARRSSTDRREKDRSYEPYSLPRSASSRDRCRLTRNLPCSS